MWFISRLRHAFRVCHKHKGNVRGIAAGVNGQAKKKWKKHPKPRRRVRRLRRDSFPNTLPIMDVRRRACQEKFVPFHGKFISHARSRSGHFAVNWLNLEHPFSRFHWKIWLYVGPSAVNAVSKRYGCEANAIRNCSCRWEHTGALRIDPASFYGVRSAISGKPSRISDWVFAAKPAVLPRNPIVASIISTKKWQSFAKPSSAIRSNDGPINDGRSAIIRGLIIVDPIVLLAANPFPT